MKLEVVEVKTENGIQVVPLPKDFVVNDDKVYLKRTGNIISIIPFHSPWQNFYDSLEEFSDDYLDRYSQPFQQNRETFD